MLFFVLLALLALPSEVFSRVGLFSGALHLVTLSRVVVFVEQSGVGASACRRLRKEKLSLWAASCSFKLSRSSHSLVGGALVAPALRSAHQSFSRLRSTALLECPWVVVSLVLHRGATSRSGVSTCSLTCFLFVGFCAAASTVAAFLLFLSAAALGSPSLSLTFLEQTSPLASTCSSTCSLAAVVVTPSCSAARSATSSVVSTFCRIHLGTR